MADPIRLTPADYDPWRVASPVQLLHLIQRLGVTSRVIACWLGVKPAAISMWARGHRPIPLRYGPALFERADRTWKEAVERNTKEVSVQPTEALQRVVQSELATIYDRWKLEVLYDAGTLHAGLRQQYEALGRVVLQRRVSAENRETIALMQEAILTKYDLLLTLQGEVPSPEDELVTRLTAAHEANEAAKKTNPPDPET